MTDQKLKVTMAGKVTVKKGSRGDGTEVGCERRCWRDGATEGPGEGTAWKAGH